MKKWVWGPKEPLTYRVYTKTSNGTNTLSSPKVAKDVLEVYTRISFYTSFATSKVGRVYFMRENVESVIGARASLNSSGPLLIETDIYMQYNDFIRGRAFTQDPAKDLYLFITGYRRIKIYDE